MRKLTFISEAQVRSIFEELRVLQAQMQTVSEPFLRREDLLTEQEVCTLLRVSPRTMLRYRKAGHFHYIKLNGTILYHRAVLYCDVLLKCMIYEKRSQSNSSGESEESEGP